MSKISTKYQASNHINTLTLFLRLPLCCCLPPGIWGGNEDSESFVIIPLLCDHFLFSNNLYFKTLMHLCIRGLLWCLWGPHRCLSPMWGPLSLSWSTITIPTQTELINSLFNLTCARVPVPLLNQLLHIYVW